MATRSDSSSPDVTNQSPRTALPVPSGGTSSNISTAPPAGTSNDRMWSGWKAIASRRSTGSDRSP